MLKQILPDLTRRSTQHELMDSPDADCNRLHRTFKHFYWLNRLVSRSHRLLVEQLFPVMQTKPDHRWTLLDLGSGPCDIPIRFLHTCRQRGFHLTITCLDPDARAHQFAREQYGEMQGLIYETGTIQDIMDQEKTFDFVFSNHVLHHLPDEEIKNCLNRLLPCIRYLVLMNDLKRSHLSYLAYSCLAGLFFRGSYVYGDGRLSIQRGFLKNELESLLPHAPDWNFKVREKLPGRLFVLGRRKKQ